MLIFDLIFWISLIATSIVFIILGFDDLLFDVSYWCRFVYRKWKGRYYKKLTYDQLLAIPEKKIALIVACWEEADVIADMVHYNLMYIDYTEFHIFIGVYPNDVPTVTAAQSAESQHANVHAVVHESLGLKSRDKKVHTAINKSAGPTNKADNLNSIYQYILDYEKEKNITFDIVVMHDPEDVIHHLSFKLYNYLIPKKSMIQVPVLPIATAPFNFVNWTYSDEFAEVHTKDMIVREVVNGFVPSAGVGTAFDRKILTEMAAKNNGLPFGIKTFTEDYSTALQLHLLHETNRGLNHPMFLVQYVERVQYCKPWYLFGKQKLKKITEMVATRALFPLTYHAAVKQRSRWTLGIVFQEWRNTGFPGKISTKYFIMHDRKAISAHFLGGFAYIIFIYWLGIFIYSRSHPYTLTLQYFFEEQPWVWVLIYICFFLMVNRILQRCIATYRIYGFLPALLSPLRVFSSNLINMHAFIRALREFITSRKIPTKARWQKTRNRFPLKNQLTPFRRRLGDILISKNLITPAELIKLLREQDRTKEKLGVMLLRKKMITEDSLLLALAKQYNLESRYIKASDILIVDQIPNLPAVSYYWLISNYYRPLHVFNNTIVIGISNPERDMEKEKLVFEKVNPYRVKFVLVQWSAPQHNENAIKESEVQNKVEYEFITDETQLTGFDT